MALQIPFFMAPEDERDVLRRISRLQLELWPEVTDPRGLPVARMEYTQCENDRKNIAFAKQTLHDIFEAAGAQDVLEIDRYGADPDWALPMAPEWRAGYLEGLRMAIRLLTAGHRGAWLRARGETR